jgi:hypothetical protein
VLPAKVQMMAVKDIEIEDFDLDGNLDIVLSGNQLDRDYTNGPLDASIGVCLLGDGKGTFNEIDGLGSGLYLDKNQTAILTLYGASERKLLSAANDEDIKVHSYEAGSLGNIKIESGEAFALITYKSDKVEKRESYYAKGYLSSTARRLSLTERMKSVAIYNYSGKLTREMAYPFAGNK